MSHRLHPRSLCSRVGRAADAFAPAARPRAVMLVAALTLLLALPGRAAAGGEFNGVFESADGERVELRQSGARVTGTYASGGAQAAIQGTVRGATLYGTVSVQGESLDFQARVDARGLSVEVDGEVMVFARVGAASRPAVADEPSTAGEPSATDEPADGGEADVPALSAKGKASDGARYKAEYEGWEVRVPKGWKHAERGGALVIASDKEAGMVLVYATELTEPAALRKGLADSLAQVGSFSATPQLATAKLKAGKAVYTEVEGTSADGAALRVRAVGVIGARGTVAILGITSPNKATFGPIRAHADAVARSVRFFAPKVSPGQRFVMGEWWSYTGSSTMSGSGGTEASLAFCPDGSFHSSRESSYSGGAGTSGAWGAASQGGNQGRWRAIGSTTEGVVKVTYGDGSEGEIAYRAKAGSDGVYFDGRLYGRNQGNACR